MIVFTSLRRLGVSVVALGASAVILAGCGSSTSGSPLGLGTGGNASGAGVTSAANGGASGGGAANGGAASSSAAAPGNSATSAASNPTVASSVAVPNASLGPGSAFCTQLLSMGRDIMTDQTGPSALKAFAAKYQKLANAAPPQIKPDIQKVADYFSSLADGKAPDPSTTTDLATSAEKIAKFLSTACI